MSTAQPSIIVCDSNKVIRQGLKAFFERRGITIVAEAMSETEARTEAERLEAEWLVIDPDSEISSSIEFCKIIKAERPKIRLIIYTTDFFATKFCNRLVRIGVHALVLKSSSYDILDLALHHVATDTILDPKLRKILNKSPANKAGFTPIELQVISRLSMRESEIAEELNLQPSVVQGAIKTMLASLKCPTKTDLFLRAKALGFGSLPTMSSRDDATGKSHDELIAEQNAIAALGG